MKIKENPVIKGIFEISLESFTDSRGYLMRTFDESIFRESGIPVQWVQENQSFNIKKNTLRGLHFLNKPHTDGKLIRCTRGEIYDVAVDLRKHSPTFGQWTAYVLTESEPRWIYLPKGFAHGYCCLTSNAEIQYKHDSMYVKESDSGIRWDDPGLGIQWPCNQPIVSEKDQKLQFFNDFVTQHGGL